MKGLAPSSLILAGLTVGIFAVVYVAAVAMKKPRAAKPLLAALFGSAAICTAYLALDKFIGVGYSEALYIGVAVAVAVGLIVGLTLRKER